MLTSSNLKVAVFVCHSDKVESARLTHVLMKANGTRILNAFLNQTAPSVFCFFEADVRK